MSATDPRLRWVLQSYVCGKRVYTYGPWRLTVWTESGGAAELEHAPAPPHASPFRPWPASQRQRTTIEIEPWNKVGRVEAAKAWAEALIPQLVTAGASRV